MSIHGVLGETTSYPQQYDPSVLFAISRTLGREAVYQETNIDTEALAVGVDIWQAFELSWLNPNGISQVAVARILIPANSPNIVESKSLKLYLNSLNFSTFAHLDEVASVIQKDLSDCIGAIVSVQIEPLNSSRFAITTAMGECIDLVLNDCQGVTISDDIDASMLADAKTGVSKTYQFHTNLLRSNCPVTNQPDWGTLSVSITTDKLLDYEKILAYVLTFRKHNGFHEQCVERIFADFLVHFQPSQMAVWANYTRRGGIDINPIRVLNRTLPDFGRLVRQ
ncbi:NADPH-dependent 7-cyano-7-deazaguanine reductase QueF [Moraxella sp.]|uniref:NADPH-dependent 7-cyano-7-deazaguanine reductase QueF n=1 Tax=Moraxella sp. TaxID=479 RepID=UPI0026DC7985|nr:NADPH-dependent 7-cyano-7-deazaguanine reductase QueF [Moraxella sp.]MDO4895153.1 NADPH-dependent 7-cyano-7-deazaguanine reductase QueF [Moraxella sp.]